MELKPKHKMDRVYLDTNIFIYFLEGVGEFADKVREIVKYLHDNKIEIITSELTMAECLVKPMQDNNIELVALYNDFLQNRANFWVMPISKIILMGSAKVKADTKGKLPDCIHLATAKHTDCKYILTHDNMKTPQDIKSLNVDNFFENF